MIKTKTKSGFSDIDRSFDELKFQLEKGLTIESYSSGTRYLELEKVKEWKSKFGYVFNIYGNEHFINNKPHFHFDNNEEGVSCKISFDGEML